MNKKKILTKSLFKKLQNLVEMDSYWSNYLRSSKSWIEIPHGVHIAIFVEPYLSYIFNGKKTIESRFSINRSPPYGKVKRDDVLLLKLSGGPIMGICQVSNVWSYKLNPKSLKLIKKKFTTSLCAQDPKFWDDRKTACYVTLMKIKNPIDVKPFGIKKRDRRGWVVYKQNIVSGPIQIILNDDRIKD